MLKQEGILISEDRKEVAYSLDHEEFNIYSSHEKYGSNCSNCGNCSGGSCGCGTCGCACSNPELKISKK